MRLSRSQSVMFMVPAAALLLGIVAYPLANTIWLSFAEVENRTRATVFVGLSNWQTLIADEVFWQSLVNAVVFTLGATAFYMCVGGAFALILNQRWPSNRLRNAVRGLLIIPWLFPFAGAALMWSLLLQPFGVVNYLLVTLG